MFSLVGRLPSTPSFESCPSPFGPFVGTMRPSDSPATCRLELDVRLMAFSNRPAPFWQRRYWGLPVPALGVSLPAWGLGLRRAPNRLERSPTPVYPSAGQNDVGALEVSMISELHTQPACAPVKASPVALRPLAHDSGSGWFATPFLCGSFIRDSEPVYPGAFSDSCPPISWTLRFSVCSTWGQVSLIHAPGLPAIPSPNTCGRSASSGRGTLPPQRVGPRTLPLGNSGLRRSPGWLASPPRPNRVQFPPLLERLLTDWPFTSRCSPPCLTA